MSGEILEIINSIKEELTEDLPSYKVIKLERRLAMEALRRTRRDRRYA